MALALLRLGHKKDSCCLALSPSPSPSLSRSLSLSLGEARRHVVRMLKPPSGKGSHQEEQKPPTDSQPQLSSYVCDPLGSRPSSQVESSDDSNPSQHQVGTEIILSPTSPSPSQSQMHYPQKLPEMMFPAILSHSVLGCLLCINRELTYTLKCYHYRHFMGKETEAQRG